MRSPSTGAMEASFSTHFHRKSGTPPDRAVEGLRMSRAFEHVPVMVSEVVELLMPGPGGLLVDATVGGGGHSKALLAARPDWNLLAVDRDREAVGAAIAELADFSDRVEVRHASFDRIGELVGDRDVAAVLFDLGVSSPQLDRAERGFSYRHDGPLDMRMDRDQAVSAATLVNGMPVGDLARLIASHGEARFARRIAGAIVAARPLRTTGELAAIVEGSVPRALRRRGHPAARVFQAIRSQVNGELPLLSVAIDEALNLLLPGGRCAVLAYHSGEDRIVKDRFAVAASGGCSCPPGLPCVCGAEPTVRLLGRGARRPSSAEVSANPRASSARLRAVERVAGRGTGGGRTADQAA